MQSRYTTTREMTKEQRTEYRRLLAEVRECETIFLSSKLNARHAVVELEELLRVTRVMDTAKEMLGDFCLEVIKDMIYPERGYSGFQVISDRFIVVGHEFDEYEHRREQRDQLLRTGEAKG